MLKNSHIRSFTVAELVISLIVMAIITIGATNVVFKKADDPENIATETNNKWICYEGSSSSNNNEADYIPSIGGCELDITKLPEIANKEFFQIRLIGGGAGKGKNKNGSNGEEKIVYYPSLVMPFRHEGQDVNCSSPFCNSCGADLKCTSCVKGYKLTSNGCKINFKYRAILGKAGSKNQNGGQTSLIIVDNSGKLLGVAEIAAGGITSESTTNSNEIIENTSSNNQSGNGQQTDGTNAHSGEVRIEW